MIQLNKHDLKTLHNDRRLGDLLELLDQLHSAASEDDLKAITALTTQELLALLREIAYTAQETIDEVERNISASEFVLRLVEKPSA